MQTIDPDYFFITPQVIPENYLELLESIKIKKELLLLRCLDNLELNKNLETFLTIKNKYQTKLILSSRHLNISERFDGIHYNSADLMNLKNLENSQNYLGASCHNKDEINKANQLKLDYVFISPIKKTKSHQETSSLGWKKFKELRLQNLESEINFHFTNNDLSNEFQNSRMILDRAVSLPINLSLTEEKMITFKNAISSSLSSCD